VPLAQVGSPLDETVPQAFPQPSGTRGEVIHVDTYGNLVTNLRAEDLPPRVRVRLGSRDVALAPFYAAVPPGELLALVGSAGLLEISARDASAAALTGARRGTPVLLEPL
jgi:S-adenosylmethionine hydrolase